MRRAFKRKSVVMASLIILSLVAALFAAVSGVLIKGPDIVSYADDGTIYINNTNYNIMSNFTVGDGSTGSPYEIHTAGQFVKAMMDGNSNYKLMYNVSIGPSGAAVGWTPAATFSGVFDGNGKTIYYLGSTSSSQTNFGLFASNSGTIKDFTYEFDGSFTHNGDSYYGALVGRNLGASGSYGIIQSVTMNLTGLISVAGNGNGQTVAAGGAVGRNDGKIESCEINSNMNVQASTYAEEDNDQEDTVAYVGGVVGYSQGNIDNCEINFGGDLQASNNHYDEGFLGLGWGATASDALYSSGGVIGYANGGTIIDSTLNLSGNVGSIGNLASLGASGGVVGYAAATALNMIRTNIVLGATMQTYSAGEEGLFYAGGLVGYLSDTAATGTFRSNVVKINIGTGNLLSANRKGTLLGYGNFDTWNKYNVWLIYDTRGSYTNFVGEGTNTSKYGVLDIRGSGSITAEIEAIPPGEAGGDTAAAQITIIATAGYSPLYGWMREAPTNTKWSNTDNGIDGFVDQETGGGEYYPDPNLQSYKKVEALFLKTELDQAGDLNVLAELTADQANWNWITVNLMNDVTGTMQFMPIGTDSYPFRGTFNGNNHKITFTSSSSISGKDYAGLFGYNEGTIQDLEIAFGGTVSADNMDPAEDLFGSPVPRTTNVYVGTFVAVNRGSISNIRMTNTSASHIKAMQNSANYRSVAGGFIGLNEGGDLADVSLVIQGKVHAQLIDAGGIAIAGGLIGYNTTGILDRVSVTIEGEVAAFNTTETTATNTMTSGGLIGLELTSLTVNDGSVTIKYEGTFANPSVGAIGAGTNQRGAIIGSYAGNSSITNFWTIMDREDDDPVTGIMMFGNDANYSVRHGENRLYIEDGIVQAEVDEDGQISMAVPIGEGEVFAGWFETDDYYNMLGADDGVSDNVFYPDMSLANVNRYTKVISSLIYTLEEFIEMAHFTNQGNDFSGVEFMLGANLTINSSVDPVGEQESTPFNGTFNGCGLKIIVQEIARTNFAGQPSIAGIFGYLSEDAHVYGLNVEVEGPVSESAVNCTYSGVIAAVNDGVIGLDSPSQKLTVTIVWGGIVQGLNAAGIVALNNGLVQNAEVIIDQGIIRSGSLSTSSSTASAGIAAINGTDGIIKNVKVTVEDNSSISSACSSSGHCYASGGVAINQGELYSIVAIMRSPVETTYVDSFRGFAGGVIGNNESVLTANLWMVCDDPEVYIDHNAEGTNIYSSERAGANTLRLYGPGEITVSVEANSVGDTSGMGGMIVFQSLSTPESGNNTFYSYFYGAEEEEAISTVRLNSADGVSDYIFTPANTLKFAQVFSVFALTKIDSLSDLKEVAEDVNDGIEDPYSGFIPELIYSLDANITITGTYSPIGNEENPFRGIFKGNQKTITFGAGTNTGITGLFGTVGENAEIQFINVIVLRTITLNALSGAEVGVIASINYGIIKNVVVTLNGSITATHSSGGIAGINYGTITAASVIQKRVVITGVVYSGDILSTTSGSASGGIAGRNYGTIGCSTVQDIKVTSDAGSSISSTGSLAGGVTGYNYGDALVMSAFMTITGTISASGSSSMVGGISGRNEGTIHTIFTLIEGSGNLSGTMIGLVAGYSSGTIGLESGDDDNINAGIFKSLSGQYVGGLVGQLNGGTIINVTIAISGNLAGVNYTGGLVGWASSGDISYINLTLNNGYSINSPLASGGLIGTSGAEISRTQLTIDGEITGYTGGSVSSVSDAGGVIGENSGFLSDVLVTLKHDLTAARGGLIAGSSTVEQCGTNVWALASNSVKTDVSTSDDTDFNSLKYVGEASFLAQINNIESPNPTISFEVMTASTLIRDWYDDITAGEIFQSDTDLLIPYREWIGMKLHLSMYDLTINSVPEYKDIANNINHNDFFYGVRFDLALNLNITGSVVPIGTEEHPFNAIFDGNGYTIKFIGASEDGTGGSSIGSLEYSGLFGYTSSDSTIENLILDIKERVVLGGQGSEYTGGLVGYSNGTIRNVLVKMASTPRASSSSRIGGVAGFFNPSAPAAINTWLIVHNASCKAASNAYVDPIEGENVFFGINVMNILGTGDLIAEFVGSTFKMTVEDIYVTNVFSGWYSDVSTQTRFNIGSIIYNPLTSLANCAYTASFIRLSIYSEADWQIFSNNINTYSGFEGVMFSLENNLTLRYADYISVGSKTNPFSGIFEGNGYTISFDGVNVYGSYPGLFGYVSSTGEINDLIVISNISATPNVFGDGDAIYSGLLASYCDGELKNIIAELRSTTTIYCVNKKGGMVGAIGENFIATNAWVILPENSTLDASGIEEDQLNIMYTAGNGSIRLQIIGGQVTFTANPSSATDPFYGYIDENNVVIKTMTMEPSDALHDAVITAIFLNSTITSYEDLVHMAESINSGLNYSGVIYSINSNITIQAGYIPIGGLVGNQIVKFKGIIDGGGHTISIPEGINIAGAYAGIVGYIDSVGGVRNLRIDFNGSIGTSSTLYAGSVAGYNEGLIENVAIYAGRTCMVNGSTGETVFVGYSPAYSAEDIHVENAWAVDFNSHDIMSRNSQGRINGLNTFTVLGAGELDIDFADAGGDDYTIVMQTPDAVYLEGWYSDLLVTELQAPELTSYIAPSEVYNLIYYISFLDTDIDSYEELNKLAEDVNAGYDFYGITFILRADIEIEAGYEAIGGAEGAFSGTLNGLDDSGAEPEIHTITIPTGVTVAGEYAGLFGNINSYGVVKNLIVDLNGTLGTSTTKYAGTFAYNEGRIENCIVSGYYATLVVAATDSYAGTVIGYDTNMLIFNTWGIIGSFNNIKAAGIKGSGVNKMKVVGAGRIAYSIDVENYGITFTNDTDYNSETDISGWYRKYSTGSLISNYLGIGTIEDEGQTYKPAGTVLNAEYEVIIIKSTVEDEHDLIVLANDINIGGYSFDNVTFTVISNFSLTSNSILIGMENSPFRGVLDGDGYTITITGNKGIFAYNEGTIKDLNVAVSGHIIGETEAAAIAYINDGVISGCNVSVLNGGSIDGVTVGAIAAVNNGTITDESSVNISASAVLSGEIVGGAVGISNGTTEQIDGVINGYILATAVDSDTAYAGGLIGWVREGVTSQIVGYVNTGALISATGEVAYAAGLLGRNRSVVKDSVIFGSSGTILAEGDSCACGQFAGISDSNMRNTWMVMRSSNNAAVGVGNGPQSVNLLTVYGNGGLILRIERSYGGLLFYKDESYTTSVIDGWYVSKDVSVSENPILGNVSSSGDDYAPSNEIMGRSISVVFINTQIETIADLIALADSVNGGMSSRYTEFTLMNDIDLYDALPESIGITESGFNYVFDGQNNSINIYYTDSSSLFGYVDSAGVIRNLNINVYGVVGTETAVYAGGLAAENEGILESCSVTIDSGASVVANTAGGLVGCNYSNGVIRNAEITLVGTVEALNAEELNRAGGIAGRNSGTITKLDSDPSEITIMSTGRIYAHGDKTPYAGGIAGQNTGIISYTEVSATGGQIIAEGTGPYNSMAGGIAGSNTGTINYNLVFAENIILTASGDKFNYVGGITGMNKYIVKNTVAYVGDGSLISGEQSDSAIGADDSGEISLITNTWVMVEDTAARSDISSVNTMVYYDGETMVAIDIDAFYSGSLEFSIVQTLGYFAVYDDLSSTEPAVYLEDVVNNEFVPALTTKGLFLLVRNSNTVSSGSELKALSAAVNTAAPAAYLTGAVISLTRDIEVEGEMVPVGTETLKFSGTFDGQGYKVTLLEGFTFTGVEPGGNTYAALFGYSNGIIRDLVIEINTDITADKVAGVTIQNFNTIERTVVDITEGSIAGVMFTNTVALMNSGTISDVWTLSRDESTVYTHGKHIFVNGNGSIEAQPNGENITFTEVSEETVLFAGWTYNNEFFSQDVVQVSTDLTNSEYGAEFVNLEIGTQADLANIARLLPMGLITSAVQFTQINDFAVTGTYDPIGTETEPFLGTYEGAGYSIELDGVTINGTSTGLFGYIGDGAIVKNLILKLGSISTPDAAVAGGLAAYCEGTLNNIVVYGAKIFNLIVGESAGTDAANLWIITTADGQDAGVDAGMIKVIGSGEIASVIDIENNEIDMTATPGATGIFAGWYNSSEEIVGYEHEITFTDAETADSYTLIFISSVISSEEEFIAFADAVTAGFDMEGYEIDLAQSIMIMTEESVGDTEHAFEGTFDGNGYAMMLFGDYTIDKVSLFPINNGTIKNLITIFVTSVGSELAEYAGFTGVNTGTVDSCVIHALGNITGVNAGGIAADTTDGTVTNSWFFQYEDYETPATNDSAKGNKLVLGESSFSGVVISDGEITLTSTPIAGKFTVWYSDGEFNEVLTEDVNLNVFAPDTDLNGVTYSMTDIDEIDKEAEFRLFASYVNSGIDFETYTISLISDIEITGESFETIGDDDINSFEGTFDGAGYTVTIGEDVVIGGDYSGLFGVNDGTIQDVIVVLNGTVSNGVFEGVVVAVNNGALINVASLINGSAFNNEAIVGENTGTMTNCWYVVASNLAREWILGTDGNAIEVIGKGAVEASFIEGELTFTAVPNEGAAFVIWSKLGETSTDVNFTASAHSGVFVAEFVSLDIYEEGDLINLARLMVQYSLDTADLTFELMNDVASTEDYVSIGTVVNPFSGTFNGNFHLIDLSIVDEVTFEGLFAYTDSASINALAVKRDTEFDTFIGNVITGNETDNTLYDTLLVTPIFDMVGGEGSELIIVGETGDLDTGDVIVSKSESNSFIITAVPNDEDDYALRGFYTGGDIVGGFYDIGGLTTLSETDEYTVPSAGGEKVMVLFRLQYTVSFSLYGVLEGQSSFTPELSGEGDYWFGEGDVTLEVTSIGDGYLYRGIRLNDDGINYLNELETYLSYTFPIPGEDQDYEAVFELINFAYQSLVYSGDSQEQEVSNDITGLSDSYTYEGIDGTVYASSSTAPTNVGNYKVTADIYIEVEPGTDLLVGIRTVGYEITPAPLVIELEVLDRDYRCIEVEPGVWVKDDSVELNGGITIVAFYMKGTDNSADIDLSEIEFRFESPDAGTWDIIVVNNTLNAANGNEVTYRNYWFGVEVGDTLKAGDPAEDVTATINPLEIEIVANSDNRKVYGDPDPEFEFTYLNEGGARPFPNDGYTGSLSREVGENVGIYKISKGNLSLGNNYNLKVYTIGAELTIERIMITLEIAPSTKQYGDLDPSFSYNDVSEGESTGIVGSDRITLSWEYPKNALPSETPYTVGALFNPVTNPNYMVVSSISRSVNGISCKYISADNYTVTRRIITVTVTGNSSKVYGNPDLTIKVSSDNRILLGDNVYAARAAGENSRDSEGNLIQYLITFSIRNSGGDVTNRYDIRYPSGVEAYYYTINPRPIYVVPRPIYKTYGDDDSEILYDVTLPDSELEIIGTLGRADGDDEGEYQITIGQLTITNNNNYELVVPSNAVYIINPRELTVKVADTATKYYGDVDPFEVDFDVTGFATGDTETSVNMTNFIRLQAGTTIGTYQISGDFEAIGDNSDNYIITVQPGTLTIAPRPIALAIENKDMVYGTTKMPAISYSLSGGTLAYEETLNDLGISFVGYDDGEDNEADRYKEFSKLNVGDYPIIAVPGNGNYAISSETGGVITITKRSIKITVNNITKVAGQDDPEFDYDIKGKLVKSSDLKGDFGREEGETPGTYLITEGNLRLNSNYDLEIDLNNATLTITRAPVSIVPIAIAGGGGAVLLGGAVVLFMMMKRLKASRIPI
jgi:hypothetical protein